MPPAILAELPPPLARGDLVGVVEAKGPSLAVIQKLHQGRAVLHVGFQARPLQRPLRLVESIASLRLPSGGESPAAAGIASPPWCLTDDLLREAQPRSRELGSAWLLLGDEPGGLSLADFSALVGQDDSPIQKAACWLWLNSDQSLFRWRQQRVESRPLASLRQLRHQRRRQQLEQARQRHWHVILRSRRPFDADSLAPEQRAELEDFRAWAAGQGSEPASTSLRQALQAAHCPLESGAIRHLLLDLGQWERHRLPSLQNTAWEIGFDTELEAEAELRLRDAERDQPGDNDRRDLTLHHVVTIDDEDTLDIDDGLSLETLSTGGERLWIHIADPGRLVPFDSPLDREARRRATSLYLARGILPMFPPTLSNGPFSLRAGHRCAAWSVWVDLDPEGEVVASGLERSWVRPAYRLSYADADELIELAPPQESDLVRIQVLLDARRRWRIRRGALVLEQAEGRIRCRGDRAELEITEPSPSRVLVAEAMILVGAVVADFGRTHGLALPYRGQLPSGLPPDAELAALPPGPVRHAAIKRCLNRGQVGCQPSAHFSLGLEAYVQATSPIRRYGDLLVQRQLAAHCQGLPPLGEAEMGALLECLEAPTRQALQISREDQRHWQQMWFEQEGRQQWFGLFLRWLRQDQRLAQVHVEDLAMDLAATGPEGSEPGDRLVVRLQQVDPLRDLLRFQAVR